MSVDLESKIYGGEQQASRVGIFDVIGGMPTYKLPINTQATPLTDSLEGKAAIAADILLDPRSKGIISQRGLALLLNASPRRVRAIVQHVAAEAQHAGVTITTNSRRGGVYIVGPNELHHRGQVNGVDKNGHSAMVARVGRTPHGSDGTGFSEARKTYRVKNPNSVTQVTHGPNGASLQSTRRRWSR